MRQLIKLLFLLFLFSFLITNSAQAVVSNGDIDDEDMADITDWTDNDGGTGASTQVTFDSKSCMKLDIGGTVGGRARRIQDVGTFGTRTVFSLNLYCDLEGLNSDSDRFLFYAFNGTIAMQVSFASNGLFILTDTSAWTEVGTDLVVQDIWQEWTFDVNWTARTADVYLDNTLQATGVSIDALDASANGTIWLYQDSGATANLLSYVDWLKAGSDFVVTLKRVIVVD